MFPRVTDEWNEMGQASFDRTMKYIFLVFRNCVTFFWSNRMSEQVANMNTGLLKEIQPFDLQISP